MMYVGAPDSRKLRFVLKEGRNRQIRKMVEAVGLEVRTLHRTAFAGITLKGLSSNNWSELTEREMRIVQQAIQKSSASSSSSGSGRDVDIDDE